MTSGELQRFEREWRLLCGVFSSIFAVALLDHLVRRPHGIEAFFCYGLGIVGLFGALLGARRLGDPERSAGALDGLGLIGEDLSLDSAELDD
jgi:hypothetical protein